MNEQRGDSSSDSGGEVNSPRTPAEKARSWTQEEMDAAVPCPMPEVPDDEGGTGDAVSPRISDIHISPDLIVVNLSDGGSACLPLHTLPILHGATQVQRAQWKVIGGGMGIRWDALGEELSLDTILSWRKLG